MTKQIDFDANLIGQEGIVVKYRNGETPDFVKSYKWGVASVNKGGGKYEHTQDGMFCKHFPTSSDLLMYRESKVMSVEEWIEANSSTEQEYQTWIKIGMNRLAAAIKEGLVEL